MKAGVLLISLSLATLALVLQGHSQSPVHPRERSYWRLLITYRDGGAYAINCLSEDDAEDKVPRLWAMPDRKLIASIVPQERHVTAWSSADVRQDRK